jgi:hypothetical protein
LAFRVSAGIGCTERALIVIFPEITLRPCRIRHQTYQKQSQPSDFSRPEKEAAAILPAKGIIINTTTHLIQIFNTNILLSLLIYTIY